MKPMKRLLSVLSLLLAVAILFSFSACKKKNKNAAETTGEAPVDFDLVSTADPIFDYYRADLSDYLTITRDNYLNLRVSLDVTDADVEKYINDHLLPSYRTPVMATDRAVADKDTVYIYYTGYTDDFPFDNGSNQNADKPYTFVVGSGDFFCADVENQLVGKIPADTSTENPLTTEDVVFPARHFVPLAKAIEYEGLGIAGLTAHFEIAIAGIVDGDDLVTDRAIAPGDTVALYYASSIGGARFVEGSNADDDEPARFVIGSGDFFFADLENQLIGKIPSETSKEHPLTLDEIVFPEDTVIPKFETKDYTDEKLVGKTVRFKITVAGIVDGENLVTDRAIAPGDTVSVYYTGYADNYAFSGGSNVGDEDPYELEIGSGAFIAGFEEALIGVRPDETSDEAPHTINVTFPTNGRYEGNPLAGKPARFDVVIKGIFDNAWNIPELTPEFVTEKLQFETEEADVVAALRLDVKNWMRENKVGNLDSHKLIRTMEELFKVLEFKDAYPEGEQERYEELMFEDVISYYQYYNYMYYMYYGYVCFEDQDEAGRSYYGLRFDADWEAYQHTESFRIVRQTMVLNMIARLEGLTVTEEDAKAWVREQMQSQQDQADQAAAQSGDEADKITPADILAEISVEEIYSKLASIKAQDFILNSITFDYGELPITD